MSAISVLKPLKDAEENGVKVEQPDVLQLCNKLATEVTNLSKLNQRDCFHHFKVNTDN